MLDISQGSRISIIKMWRRFLVKLCRLSWRQRVCGWPALYWSCLQRMSWGWRLLKGLSIVANFHSYARMYNRADDQLVKFITEGVYPSAMPSWKGREDKDKNVVFDDPLILDLVKYVRAFAYENDLPDEESKGPVSGPKHSKELSALTSGSNGKRERHSSLTVVYF